MKFAAYEKCVAIVALYECAMTAKMICRTLKPLSVNKWFVSQTLAHYLQTDDVTIGREKGVRDLYKHGKLFMPFVNK